MSKARAIRTRSLPSDYTSTPLNVSPREGAGNSGVPPLIIMSGYLTKKARGRRLGNSNRWLRRWWQLLGDGTLIYFKGEERLKVLGEVDIAHTCYEVRLGAGQCNVDFPSIIPPNCCFSVSVLKRTFYFFAPSPIEAKKWSTTLSSVSYILNRSRPRNLINHTLSHSPPKQQTKPPSEGSETEPPTPPTVPPPPSSRKAPPPPPPINSSSLEEDSTEGEDEPADLPSFQEDKKRRQNLSVPDLRYDTSYHHHSPDMKSNKMRASHSPSSSLLTPHTSTSLSYKGNKQHQCSGSMDKTRQYQIPSGVILRRNLKENRARFSDRHTSHSDLRGDNDWWADPLSTLPTAGKLNRLKWHSELMDNASTLVADPTFDKLEELQKREEEIKRKLRDLRKTESEEAPFHQPLMATENLFLNFPKFVDHSQTEQNEHSQQDLKNNIKIVSPRRKKPLPPRKIPKPIRRRDTPFNFSTENDENSFEMNASNQSANHIDSLEVNGDTSGDTHIHHYQGNIENKSSAIRSHEANVWVKSELNKVN